jgi:hypothetical protein
MVNVLVNNRPFPIFGDGKTTVAVYFQADTRVKSGGLKAIIQPERR